MSPSARHWIALLALAALSAFLQFANVRQTEQGGVVHATRIEMVADETLPPAKLIQR